MIKGLLTKVFARKTQDTQTFEGDHPARDEVLGFIDSHDVQKDLVSDIKDRLTQSSSQAGFIIAIDAQNLGQLNALTDRNTADAIWRDFANGYIEAIATECPKAEVISGFRDAGDEAQIVISGHGLRQKEVSKALDKAAQKMKHKYEGTGLDLLPPRENGKPQGFGFHTAIAPLTAADFSHMMTDGERVTSRMRDFYNVPELIDLATQLNQNKAQALQSAHEVLTPATFREEYSEGLKIKAASMTAKPPTFKLPAHIYEQLPASGDKALKDQNHKAFLENAPENAALLRFDLSGLRLLNKYMQSIEVEGILGRTKEAIDHHFYVAGSTHDTWFSSYDVGAGVVDVLVDADDWNSRKQENLAHINAQLINLYELHILEDHADTWDRLGMNFSRVSTPQERRQIFMDRLPPEIGALFTRLDKEFLHVETAVIKGDAEQTLANAAQAIQDLKTAQAQDPTQPAIPPQATSSGRKPIRT